MKATGQRDGIRKKNGVKREGKSAAASVYRVLICLTENELGYPFLCIK